MKTTRSMLVVFMITLFVAVKCNKSSDGLDSCKNLPNIQFKNEQVGIDKEATLRIITELAAAAKADALSSKQIAAEGSVNIKSEFGRKLKENVSASQDVSDDFWEQNITLTQLLCFTEAQSKRKDLTASQKDDFHKLLLQIITHRNEYLIQRGSRKDS